MRLCLYLGHHAGITRSAVHWLLRSALLVIFANIAPAHAENIGQNLARCQDQAVPPKQRHAACSSLIDDKTLDVGARVEALLNRGMMHEGIGESTDALADYTTAAELDPDNELAFFNRGNVYEGLGQFEEAIRNYDRAIELNAHDADFFNNRGRAWESLGKIEKAMADFGSAIHIDPKHGSAYVNRALSLADTGEYATAIKDFDKAISLGVDDPEVWAARGGVNEALGRAEAARHDFAKTIAANPSHERALEGLARLQK